MIENFLKFGGGVAALMRCQTGFATHIDGIQRKVAHITQFAGTSTLKNLDGFS
jgi:hypothetical protein